MELVMIKDIQEWVGFVDAKPIGGPNEILAYLRFFLRNQLSYLPQIDS